ncbi:MAG: cytochrome c [Acidimicrobiia bacterium]|nr:cytochrome c [Acidimicrobiia bacterium]
MRLRVLGTCVLFLLAACTGPPDPDATGAELYTQFCARCHASDLSGGVGPAMGAGSELVERPDSYVTSAITNGRGSMPAFTRTLSEDHVQRLVDFIRSEQGS